MGVIRTSLYVVAAYIMTKLVSTCKGSITQHQTRKESVDRRIMLLSMIGATTAAAIARLARFAAMALAAVVLEDIVFDHK
ncbi:hypothetical protein PG987_003120 [Apiospora arundinis]|uniref:Secreted protein n=1 Tax=Apiospora arundinis TaxID=335852 RepID=A0ABR2HZ48_9PEZI